MALCTTPRTQPPVLRPAALCLYSPPPHSQSGEALRNAEEASAAAAAQAARADSLARALRKAENTRDQLQRLKV